MTEPEPYTFLALNGATLTVTPETTDAGQFAAIRADEPVLIDPETLPRFVAALHAAVGLPRQIVVDRPDVDLTEGLSLFDGLLGVSYETSSGCVTVRSWTTVERVTVPAAVREAAAQLAAFADLAAAEPDPDTVEQLAQQLQQIDIATGLADQPADGYLPDMYVTRARALLRSYEIRERRP